MIISLRPVTIENWYDCARLKVTAEQLNVFPAPVVYWIAESKYMDDFELRAVYEDDEIVGFIVFCNKPDEEGNFWIPAFMMDEKQQGKGYGRAAMKELIAYMSVTLNCSRIMIGHRPNNQAAGHLYESLGFSKVSEEVIDGEIIRVLQM
ncbi:GNAT family N-acetyltransferase [Paenibacillus mendelii]|uniref:GNAT family N-acetyltransferase n=1 Tax=Paenibacillus mendelii TaxID=206163 RepID=A0ABV6J2J4_9BACL|nr:GNAT family N-acetyltransferase [Paenibacillus mendelii]MCQ6563258.1 GNAT family N-acetyltransferase [Paenibacillus mendelii]